MKTEHKQEIRDLIRRYELIRKNFIDDVWQSTPRVRDRAIEKYDLRIAALKAALKNPPTLLGRETARSPITVPPAPSTHR